MANWSNETYYFGKHPSTNDEWECESQQWALRQLSFDDPDLQVPFMLSDITTCGPAICVSGDGKYGVSMPLSKQSWDALLTGIVVSKIWDAYSFDTTMTITINGETVYQKTMPDEDTDEGPRPPIFPKFIGRTELERLYLDRLYEAMNNQMFWS